MKKGLFWFTVGGYTLAEQRGYTLGVRGRSGRHGYIVSIGRREDIGPLLLLFL